MRYELQRLLGDEWFKVDTNDNLGPIESKFNYLIELYPKNIYRVVKITTDQLYRSDELDG